jgi:hypothetical protein
MSQTTIDKTPDWLRRIVAKMEAAESLQPTPFWLEGEFPLWVQNIARELAKTAFPVAKLSPNKPWHPGEVGALVGHQFAYWHFIFEQLSDDTPVSLKLLEQLRQVFGADIEERTISYWETVCNKTLPAFDKALKFALCLAADQDYSSASSFFSAYGRAVLRKPANRGDIGRTNTGIYLIMLTSWRRVEECGSIPELHSRLCRCVFLGSHMVGDIKRVEKMCNRIELSYPKIEASKARAKNPDMSV